MATTLKITVTFTKKDVTELYYMIRNRGESGTRRKLLRALKKLDPRLADAEALKA